MTTRYKHIHFTEEPTMITEDKSTWFCRNNKTKDVLGTVTWYAPWRRWVFEGEPDCLFDHNCLRDVIDFLQKQLGEV